jgi:pimeloyl-ACP methyl ester carboxylesterase
VAGALTRFRDGRGDPLLLLHGLGLSWRSWKPVLPLLTPHHDVIAPDLPGFGDAPVPDAVPTVAALADAIEAELDAAGIGTTAVAGNSLGGSVGLELARRGRALRVVVLGPAGTESAVERVGHPRAHLRRKPRRPDRRAERPPSRRGDSARAARVAAWVRPRPMADDPRRIADVIAGDGRTP